MMPEAFDLMFIGTSIDFSARAVAPTYNWWSWLHRAAEPRRSYDGDHKPRAAAHGCG